MLIQLLEKDEDAQVRSASAQALAAISRPKEQVVLALTQALEEDTASSVRGSAALALSGFGAEEGVIPALVHALELEKNSGARWSIVEGLGRIGPKAKEAVPALIRVLEGEENEVVRWNAARVLKTITGQDLDAAHWRAWWEEQQP